MLSVLESLLQPALHDALGDAAVLSFAPTPTTPPDSAPQVSVFAARIQRQLAKLGDEDTETRATPTLKRSVLLTATAGDPHRYALPVDAVSGSAATATTVGDVQSPPGRVLALGDAYSIESGAVVFMTAPTAPVLVTLRGERSRGYVEQAPAQIDLEIGVWADSADMSDALSSRALAAVLGTFAELDLVDLSSADPAGGLTLTLLRPIVRLSQIDCSVGQDAKTGTDWHRQVVTLVLRGELELTLTLGVPAPSVTIQSIDIQLTKQRADGKTG